MIKQCPKCKSTDLEVVITFTSVESMAYVEDWNEEHTLNQCNNCMKVFTGD